MTQKKSAPAAATVQSANTIKQNQFTPNSRKKQSPGGFNVRAEIESLVREAYLEGKSGIYSDFYTMNDDDFLTQVEKDNALTLTGTARSYFSILRKGLQEAYQAGHLAVLKEAST